MTTGELHLEESGVWVTAGETLGDGGEGVVSAVDGNAEIAIKRRVDGLPLPEREARRLRALIDLALPERPTGDPKFVCAWPREIVRDKFGRPVGFAMRRAPGKPLRVSALLSVGGREQRTPNLSFALTTSIAAGILRLADACHQLGVVFCDLNDRGILLADNQELWLIDLDSVQFLTPQGIGYLSGTFTPDYLPPEANPASFDQRPRTVAEDNYTLSYLAFRILMAGFEPYDGRRLDGQPVDLAEHARAGFYAYSSNGSPVKPPLRAPSVDVLSAEVARLFERTFVAGAADPSQRASAAELADALDRQAAALTPCAGRRTHLTAAWPACPWCEWEQRVGISDAGTAARSAGRNTFRNIPAAGSPPTPNPRPAPPRPWPGVPTRQPTPPGALNPVPVRQRRPVNWPIAVRNLLGNHPGYLSEMLLTLHWPAWLDGDGRKVAAGIAVAIAIAWLLTAAAGAAVVDTPREMIR